MPTFPLKPSGYTAGNGWRPLRNQALLPKLAGWDVYDLQCKLAYLGDGLSLDGVFGKQTETAVKGYQADVSPIAGPVDGIAGSRTQVSLGADAALHGELPERVRGQMEKESSNLCGIYTAQYDNGSQDTGPVQRNTMYHSNLADNFDVAKSLPLLVSVIRSQHKRYVGWGIEDERAWKASQGYWNNQVYADRYARGQGVPQSFLDYIAAVTIYA